MLFVIAVALFAYLKLTTKNDATIPVISCKEDTISISVKDTEEDLVQHVSAFDVKDGDLSDKVFIENMTPYISSGRTDITYVVCDSDNHVGRLTVSAFYSDYHSPHFDIKKPLIVPMRMRGFDYNDYIGIDDCIDGNELAQNLIVVSNLDISTPGTYDLTVKATNSRFDSSTIDLSVTVVDGAVINPISLNRYIVYCKTGAVLNFMSYVSASEEDSVKVNTDNVDLYTPGIYEAVYTAEGRDATRLVVVCEEDTDK